MLLPTSQVPTRLGEKARRRSSVYISKSTFLPLRWHYTIHPKERPTSEDRAAEFQMPSTTTPTLHFPGPVDLMSQSLDVLQRKRSWRNRTVGYLVREAIKRPILCVITTFIDNVSANARSLPYSSQKRRNELVVFTRVRPSILPSRATQKQSSSWLCHVHPLAITATAVRHLG